jgi:excisionase family DNA binding protein
MSSNITVVRVCEYCGDKFNAKTTVTKYCSSKCNRAYYKRRIRNQKIEVSNRQTASLLHSHFDLIQSKEFLTVKDLSVLLNSSRQTIYNLINSGKIRAINILTKKTLIPRSEVDKLFLPPDVIPVAPDLQKVIKVEACYHIGEIERKFNISGKALYEIIKRYKVPKLKMGKFTYVPKSRIDELLNPEN